MVTDYGGTKGPRALGPLFLEDASLALSLFLTVILLPRLLRVPCSELLITFACISSLFLFLARFSRHFSPRTISLLHALCIWRSRDSRGLCGRTGPSFPRKKSRIGFAVPRTVTWADEKAWLRKKLQTRCGHDERRESLSLNGAVIKHVLYLKVSVLWTEIYNFRCPQSKQADSTVKRDLKIDNEVGINKNDRYFTY